MYSSILHEHCNSCGVWDEAVKQHGMYTLVKDGPLHISANTCMLV